MLEVYHGTPNDFNIFVYNKNVQTGTDFGKAYYFTTNYIKAKGYSRDSDKDIRIKEYEKNREILLKNWVKTQSIENKNKFLNYKVNGKSLADLLNDEEYDTGGNVKKVYLNVINPLIVDAKK